MRYVIGTGFAPSTRYNWKRFFALWYNHVKEYASPDHIFVLDQTNQHLSREAGKMIVRRSYISDYENAYLSIVPSGNLGHVHQLIGQQEPKKDHQWCGWSASVIALSWLGYNADVDWWVYVEQDCLIFGRIIEAAINEAELHKKDMLFGSCKIMNAAQSFFIVRHRFIPHFTKEYLMGPSDSDPNSRPEKKFAALQKANPGKVGRFSFGVDRDRPIPWDEPFFYVQQLTEEEIREGIRRKKILDNPGIYSYFGTH